MDGILSQVSCSSAGNCAVAGNYQDPQGFTHPLVASERGGVWGLVHPVTGPAEAMQVISCSRAAGNCSAGGASQRSIQSPGAFVVSEKDGVWGPARQVANAQDPVTTMSCPAAGDCLAGIGGAVGDTGPLTGDGLLVSEHNGRWGLARLVPGLDGLTLGASAVASVTCVAPGQCTAGGSYVDASGRAQVFIAAERHGVWGPARPLPGLAALNKGGRAALTDVSCAGAGSCSAGGWYYNSPHAAYEYQAWVATEVHGRWGKAAEVPRTAALNSGGLARVNSVSCTATECTAGGYYTTLGASHPTQAFLVTERNGDWGNATQVPGLAALNTGDQAEIASVSCAPPGWCTAVGNYVNRKTREPRMFVVSQR